MAITCRLALKRSSVLAAALGVGLAGAAYVLPALADHHRLKRALQNARCIPMKTVVVQHQGAMIVYDVDCVARSPDRVFVICNVRVCLPDDPDHHNVEDESP